MRPLAVLLAGGGTAGHVSPLLALADCLRRREPTTALLALGTAAGLEARLVPARGYELATIPRVPLPRRPGPDLARLPGALAGAVRQAEAAIRQVGAQVGAPVADVVVGLGGYVAAPAYLAARRLGVPVVVHEANSRPGIANRLGARLSRHVAVTFPGTRLPHAVVTGLPLRREITQLDRAAERSAARAAFDLDPDALTLLVTGGSLGAARINDALAGALEPLLAPTADARAVQVLHLTGAGKSAPVRAALEGLPSARQRAYQVREYTDRMDLALAAADLALARAGAATVCEFAAVGLPAVYVPLPIGNGEQRRNAAGLVAAGGGVVVADGDVTPAWVAGGLRDLLTDEGRRHAMGVAAARTGVRDGDERLADLVEAAAGRGARVAARTKEEA